MISRVVKKQVDRYVPAVSKNKICVTAEQSFANFPSLICNIYDY